VNMPQINHIPPRPFIPTQVERTVSQRPEPGQAPGASFKDVLQERLLKTESLKFSRHAVERMESRGISLSDEQLERIESVVDGAAGKGARESLILMDGVAMVVSIDNRTVITCMDQASMREHIFTNIDSAAVVS
jgi:flagellar operon protein